MEHRGLAIAVGDRAGLVEQQHVHVARDFHRLARLGQHVGGQRAVHAGDADRRKQAADGGGNQADQQRDQQQRIDLDADERADRRQRGADDDERQRHRGKQHRQRDLVGRLLPVGAFHQRDHPIEEAVAGLGGDAHHDLVGQHLGAADHAAAVGAGLAQHRRGFAGHRRLVDRRQAVDDLAVGGNQFTLRDDDQVAGPAVPRPAPAPPRRACPACSPWRRRGGVR